MSIQILRNEIWPKLTVTETAFIPLTHGKVCIVDLADFSYLNRWKWHAKKIGFTWYARRTSYSGARPYNIYMHRQLMRCPPAKIVHHRNKNGLDNRRINLLIMSRNNHKTIHKNYDPTELIEKS